MKESGPKLRIESIMKPRDPPELNGLSIATGRESVISLPRPIFEKTKEMPLLMISNKPLFLKNEIATNIPRTYGKMVIPVFNPLFAPLTKASNMVVFFSTNFFSCMKENIRVNTILLWGVMDCRYSMKTLSQSLKQSARLMIL